MNRKLLFKRKTLWCSETETLATEIKTLCEDYKSFKDVPPLTYAQLVMVREVTDCKMSEYTITKDYPAKESVFGYRMLSLFFMIIVIPCIMPVLAIKWVFTGKFSISSQNKFGLFVDYVYKKGGF